jgi:hypothetical protein
MAVYDRPSRTRFVAVAVSRVSPTAVRVVTLDGVTRVLPVTYRGLEVGETDAEPASGRAAAPCRQLLMGEPCWMCGERMDRWGVCRRCDEGSTTGLATTRHEEHEMTMRDRRIDKEVAPLEVTADRCLELSASALASAEVFARYGDHELAKACRRAAKQDRANATADKAEADRFRQILAAEQGARA